MTKRKTVPVMVNGTQLNLGVMVTLEDVTEIARALGISIRIDLTTVPPTDESQRPQV